MRMEREPGTPGPIIKGFTAEGFRVDDRVFPALLLTVDSAADWSPPPIDTLAVGDVEALLDPAPEFVLIGTGPTLVHPPHALVRALDERGIGVEVMDSRAAARAWGVVRGEGRVIAAALYPLTR